MIPVNKNLTFTLILSVIPLGGIGIDLLSPGLPQIADCLNVGQQDIKLTLTIFLFGLFLGMLACGPLSDIVGRKKIQIMNSAAFLASSMLIVFANHYSAIIILRLVQGISAGGLQVVSRSMISDIFRKNEITRKSLYVTMVWGLGPIVAPGVGGAMIYRYGWRSCFYFFIAYGVIITLLNSILLKETIEKKTRITELRLVENTLDIIKSRHFLLPCLIMSTAYSSLICYGVAGPYFIQKILGRTPVFYGRLGVLTGCGYVLGTLLCRYFVNKKYSESSIIKASLLLLCCLNLVCYVTSLLVKEELSLFLVCNFSTCLCMGIIYPIYMSSTIRSFPINSGLASSLVIATVLLISSLIAVLFSIIEIQTTSEFICIFVAIAFSISSFCTLSQRGG